ncbi:MAG: alanine racemase [Syntrophobacteraceae bacterium]
MPLNWVEIDLAALRHNFFQARDRVAAGSKVLGVVKSDAYGHGMVPVARELEKCGAGFLAVGKFWEALELRRHGIGLPVLVLLGLEAPDIAEAIRLGIRPAIFRLDQARMMSDAAVRLNMPARVHVKIDTGMGRLGVPCKDLGDFAEKLKSLPGIVLEGLLSHFAEADEPDKTYCEFQIKQFGDAMGAAAGKGLTFPYLHMSNSAGVIDLPHAHFHLVRPGIMLYGSPPSGEPSAGVDLEPVMTFKSRIIQLKEVPAGQPIGYGRTFVTERPSRIATVPVGYDDGYFRLLSNRGLVLVRGKRAPVAGRVSMNIITLDVTHIPEAREDDEVVLLGRQGNERITADEIAKLCGTISYEVYCAIGKQQRFKYFLNASTDTK